MRLLWLIKQSIKKEIFTTTDRGITWKKVVYKINDIYKLV